MSSHQFHDEIISFEFSISKLFFHYEIKLLRFVIFEFVVDRYQQL